VCVSTLDLLNTGSVRGSSSSSSRCLSRGLGLALFFITELEVLFRQPKLDSSKLTKVDGCRVLRA